MTDGAAGGAEIPGAAIPEAEILAILRRLVGFDTTSHKSNLALIDWAEDHLAARGFRSERLPDASGEKASLYATIGPEGVPGYVLSGHTDTVPVEGQAWASDPFAVRREARPDGDRVYGRGVCDMKGFLAVCLAGADLMRARADRLARPIHLALSYDEEVGCTGVRDLVERLAGAAVRPAGCFVGEPSEMGVVVGHKGKRSVRVRVRGATCHSSLAPRGVNAVEWGARLVAEIRRLADGLAERGARDALYDVAHSTGHVGVFRGGTALNIVPDEAEIVFEFRTIGADDPDALVAEVRDHAERVLAPAMRAVAGTDASESGFAFDVFAGFPGLDTAPEAEITALAKRLARRNEHAKVAYGTEAGLFSAVAGVPSIVVGPGSIEQAHKADEWIAVAELAACARFVERLVDHCCAPPAP